MKLTRLFIAVLPLSLMAALPLSAAEFSPALEAQLEKADPQEMVSAIVILESPIDIRALDWRLHDEKAGLQRRHEQVISALKYNAESTQPVVKDEFDLEIAKGEMTGYTAYWVENLFVIEATRRYIELLRDRGDIKYVTENFKAELIEPSYRELKPGADMRPPRNPLDNETTTPGQDAIRATQVNRELGITGAGVLVANLDTGVDGNHGALASRWRGTTEPNSECWLDLLGTGTTFPVDNNNHGTHVMGTITGREIIGSDTNTVGSAPDARWIACNAINQGVSSDFDNDVIAAFQWFTDPDGNSGTLDDVPDVIQNSWGVFTGLGYAQCFDYWNSVILNCEAAGPVITWSAGNEGTSGLRSPAIYSLNAYQIFSVGAVDATNYSAPYPIAGFSSRGPTPCLPAVPDNIKPEISAPGVDVYSSVPGGGYNGTYSGTSMAGPHVAGVVALMRQACPDCDPVTIKDAIMQTAVDYGSAGQDNTYGWGFIDAYEAVLAVSNLGRIGGIVDDGAVPLQGVKVKIASGSNQTLTDVSGLYFLPLSAGTYDVDYSKFGYLPQTFNNITVIEGDTTFQNVSLSLAPQGVLSGTVTSCYGGPAVGATVEILDAPITPTTTDGAGFYSFNLPQGTYDVRAYGAGCGEQLVTGLNVGVNTVQDFTLPNDPRFACSAPDGGGYVACEDGDADGPILTWLEIFPGAGGPGANSGITGDDSGVNLAIPFNFRFYGTDYTSVWVCSNGFLSFSGSSIAYTNESLPNASLGIGIAPFWDDLNPNGAERIAFYYHAAENAFVIEWYQIGHYGSSGSLETFQIWLYDVATNPGPNGDSQIRIQYLDMTALGSETVGTSDGTTANQYTFNGADDINAQGLQDTRVITYGGDAAEFGTVQGVVTDVNSGASLENVLVSRVGSLQTTTTNAGGFYTLNVPPGTYDFEFSRNDYLTASLTGIIVNDQDILTENVQMTALPVIEGIVTDASTLLPLAGVTVTRAGSAQTATTNGSGFYSMYFDPGSFSFDYDLTGYAPYSGSLITFSAGDIITRDVALTALPIVTLLNEDFETGAPGWTHEAAGGWFDQWHSSTERANSGTNSYKCGDTGAGVHANLLDARLISPNLTNIPANATVSFVLQIESETSGIYPDSAYDGGIVEVTTNGVLWEQVAPTTGYTHTFRYESGGGSPASGPMPGLPCFAGTNIVWTQYTIDLSAYEGGDLQIRFRFGSDAGAALEGWYVDDVVVQGYGDAFAAPASLTIYLDGTGDNLVFRWDDSGAPQYQLWSSTSSEGPFATLEGTTAANTLTLSVPADMSLYYVVVATNGGAALSAPSQPANLR